MTLPAFEDLRVVLDAGALSPRAGAGPRDFPREPADSAVIRIPLNPILCKDWFSDLQIVPTLDQPFFAYQDLLYSGAVDDDHRFTGSGTFLFPTGKVFRGEFRDGKRHGPGIEWSREPRFQSGDPGDPFGSMHVHIGHWVDNVREGPGTRFFSNGSVYEGDYRNGVPHGRGVMVTPNGMTYDGEWSAGVMSGEGVSCWKDDRRYSGHWRGGCCHGPGTMRWPDDSVYRGDFDQGQMHGQGVFTTADGLLLQGTWRRGQRHGAGTVVSVDGMRLEGDWEGSLEEFLPLSPNGTPSKQLSMKGRIAKLLGKIGSHEDPVKDAQPKFRRKQSSPTERRSGSTVSAVSSASGSTGVSPMKPKLQSVLSSSSLESPGNQPHPGFQFSSPASTPRSARGGRGSPRPAFGEVPEAPDAARLLALWKDVRKPIWLDHSLLLSKAAHIPVPDGPVTRVQPHADPGSLSPSRSPAALSPCPDSPLPPRFSLAEP
eukprot:EG_transcript_7854